MDRLKQLETFVAVAQRGSLTAAANAEGVAPAVIGRRIDALEERLGVKLLVRTTRRISLTPSGGQVDGASSTPTLSANARYVAFDSSATDLVPGDANGTYDVFLRDRRTRTTTIVSVRSGGDAANGGSSFAAISADGRYVVFASTASNLVDGDTDGKEDVFLHDRVTRTTTRISVATDGKIITAAPTNGFRNDLAEKALKDLSGDTKGASFMKATVTVTEGGK